MVTETPSKTEATYEHEHHTPGHRDLAPHWCVPDMAAQQKLGLRSQRGGRLGCFDPGHFVVDWKDLAADPLGIGRGCEQY